MVDRKLLVIEDCLDSSLRACRLESAATGTSALVTLTGQVAGPGWGPLKPANSLPQSQVGISIDAAEVRHNNPRGGHETSAFFFFLFYLILPLLARSSSGGVCDSRLLLPHSSKHLLRVNDPNIVAFHGKQSLISKADLLVRHFIPVLKTLLNAETRFISALIVGDSQSLALLHTVCIVSAEAWLSYESWCCIIYVVAESDGFLRTWNNTHCE